MNERLFFPHRARPATSTVVVTRPSCKTCGARLLRWGWYEDYYEPIRYWYCLECDKASREPCIQVRLKVEQTVA